MDYLEKLKKLGIIIYKIENQEYHILLHSVQDPESKEQQFSYFKGEWIKEEDHSPNYAA